MFAKALVSSNDSHGIKAYTGGGPAAVEGTQFYQGSVKIQYKINIEHF